MTKDAVNHLQTQQKHLFKIYKENYRSFVTKYAQLNTLRSHLNKMVHLAPEGVDRKDLEDLKQALSDCYLDMRHIDKLTQGDGVVGAFDYLPTYLPVHTAMDKRIEAYRDAIVLFRKDLFAAASVIKMLAEAPVSTSMYFESLAVPIPGQ